MLACTKNRNRTSGAFFYIKNVVSNNSEFFAASVKAFAGLRAREQGSVAL
jgi:hypothetical protein